MALKAIILILAVCLLWGWIQSCKVVPPTVSTGFIGFTNSGAGMEAMFALSNPPPVAMSVDSVRKVDRLSGEIGDHADAHFRWAKIAPWGMICAISVKNTNDPLQVVFRFQQRSAGPRRLMQQVLELWGRVTRNDQTYFTGEAFHITNQFRPDRLFPEPILTNRPSSNSLQR